MPGSEAQRRGAIVGADHACIKVQEMLGTGECRASRARIVASTDA